MIENKLGNLNLTAYLNEQEKKKNNAPDVMDIFQAYEEYQKAVTWRRKTAKRGKTN